MTQISTLNHKKHDFVVFGNLASCQNSKISRLSRSAEEKARRYSKGSVPFQSTVAPGHRVRMTRSSGGTKAPFSESSAVGGVGRYASLLQCTVSRITCLEV